MNKGKLSIYQVMTRLFGNKTTCNKIGGSIGENGVGKFADINDTALLAIKDLGVNCIWYTGVLEHASMNDYTAAGIPSDDHRVVKGKAGSPYAIKDYYDLSPDLAVEIPNRMAEFLALINRTHAHGMKALIDFVPNHVARKYHSDKRPDGIEDLGEKDNTTLSFHPNNNFYYIPGQTLVIPEKNGNQEPENEVQPAGATLVENPAKATGNDVFTAWPGVNDWYETVKLNYGVDVLDYGKKYFDPIPSTWLKMYEILSFWVQKGVDGFRCDMTEMVPVEFWAWVIPKVKKLNPDLIFIAEIYNPAEYNNYIQKGKFDYLYDKVGLYDCLRRLMEGHGSVKEITRCWQEDSGGFSAKMLRFLENHDEQRIASRFFANTPWVAVPAMTICATLGEGPVMLYFGQEVGEPANGPNGFSGDDGRTTIFDYWGVPEHQKWMNNGAFDGGQLSEDQKKLRSFYQKLLNLTCTSEALKEGRFYGLQYVNDNRQSEGYDDNAVYTYLRFSPNERLLVVVNFSKDFKNTFIKIPNGAWHDMALDLKGTYSLNNLLNPSKRISFLAEETIGNASLRAGIPIELAGLSAAIFNIQKN
jgi:glycosidase